MAMAYNSTKIHGNSELHGCIYVHEYIGSPIIKKLNAGTMDQILRKHLSNN